MIKQQAYPKRCKVGQCISQPEAHIFHVKHNSEHFVVADEYRENTGDKGPMVIASTASPYKFTKSVLSSISDCVPDDEFEAIDKLNELTGVKTPEPIWALRNKKIRFSEVIDKTSLDKAIFKSLNI